MARLAAFLTVILLISGSAMPQSVQDFIDCLSVLVYFNSCLGFLNGQMHEPTRTCCMGVRELNRLASQNHDALRGICQCIELIAGIEDAHFVLANINALPNKCETHLSFPISVKKDCSEV